MVCECYDDNPDDDAGTPGTPANPGDPTADPVVPATPAVPAVPGIVIPDWQYTARDEPCYGGEVILG